MVRRAHRERPPVARVDGQPVSVEEASDAAAAILKQARAPLVYGLGGTSCEAQRRAVAIADATGAVLDPAGGSGAGLAYAAIGSSTATFGEIRDRAELVVVWRADPPSRIRGCWSACGRARSSSSTATSRRCGSSARGSTARRSAIRRQRSTTSPAACVDARHVAFLHGALDELEALALF